MKMENLFVTWQQRSAPASMPISVSSPSASCTKLSGPPMATVPELTALCPGRGVGDPEAVVPLGALLCDSSAL